jgi:hypothetical protein
MLQADCHLTWLDATQFNNENFFSFIWTQNEEKQTINAESALQFPYHAKPPSCLVFYDLNSAKFTETYKNMTESHQWDLVLFDSYLKPVVSAPKRRPKPVLSKNTTDIFYICQFKRRPAEDSAPFNKEQHSLPDTIFKDKFKKMTANNPKQQLYAPSNLHPICVSSSAVSAKHFYWSALYKPIDSNETKVFIEDNLCDSEFLAKFNHYQKLGIKLVYLKAYKNLKSILKFLGIFTNMPFYEGTVQFFMGLTKDELLGKINQMREHNLYATIITSYGMVTHDDEFIYAALFTQASLQKPS